MESVELVAVADPVAAAREALAAECGTAAVADFHELIGRIDAAIVAVPTRLHHAVGLPLLGAGIHLLMEKPITPTVEEADELVALARASNAVLQVGHIERFNPALAELAPHIVAPKYLEAARHTGYTFRSTDVGVVLDLMIHDLDIVLSLVQAPLRAVDALGVAVIGPHEDVAQARLTFENGAVANLSASRVSYQPQRKLQVWSASGFAAVDFAERKNVQVRLGEPLTAGTFQGAALSPEQMAHYKDQLFEELLPRSQSETQNRNAMLDELTDFVTSIQTGQTPRVTGEQGRDALAAAGLVLESIARHAWDGRSDGRVGPLAQPRRSILRGPHWGQAANLPAVHREAG
jgi:predicted dehydrogenase